MRFVWSERIEIGFSAVLDRTKQVEISFVLFISEFFMMKLVFDETLRQTEQRCHKPGVHFYCFPTHVLQKNIRLHEERNIFKLLFQFCVCCFDMIVRFKR